MPAKASAAWWSTKPLVGVAPLRRDWRSAVRSDPGHRSRFATLAGLLEVTERHFDIHDHAVHGHAAGAHLPCLAKSRSSSQTVKYTTEPKISSMVMVMSGSTATNTRALGDKVFYPVAVALSGPASAGVDKSLRSPMRHGNGRLRYAHDHGKTWLSSNTPCRHAAVRPIPRADAKATARALLADIGCDDLVMLDPRAALKRQARRVPNPKSFVLWWADKGATGRSRFA